MSMGKSTNGGQIDEPLRISKAGRLLPEFLETARLIFPACEVMQRTAVLNSWVGLAGINGWTPAMVERVEVEMAK